MSDFCPSAVVEEGVLHVRLLGSPPVRLVEIDCVADLTDFDELVGVEILDLRRQLAGGKVQQLEPCGDVRWSYDDEMDALYVRVTSGRGQVQRRVTAQGQLDSLDQLVQLDVPVPGRV